MVKPNHKSFETVSDIMEFPSYSSSSNEVLTMEPHNLIPTDFNEILTTFRTNEGKKYSERTRSCNSITFELIQYKGFP